MLLSIFTLATAVAAGPVARSTLDPADFQKDVLAASNWYRGQHSADNFKWDDDVAASAQNWADRCSFDHESQSKYGENIAAGTFGSWYEVVNLWGRERKDYNWNNPGFSGATGHFTALVWKATTFLGCGFKECPGNGITVVCRFSPPGNIFGNNNQYFKDNVGEQVRGSITDVYEG